ncbi:MAG: hypothetical protein K5765_01895 [Clostridia bacterium]|nr:hypothetical protein [Clostridia bacterium]
MNKDKKIKNQKAENKQKVVTALTDLDRVISKLQKHVSRYDKQIDAAGLRNDANEVKKLIKQKMNWNHSIKNLAALKEHILFKMQQAEAGSELVSLSGAIAGLKGLDAASPDFDKLNKTIEKVFKDVENPFDKIADINKTLDNVISPEVNSSLYHDDYDPVEDSEEYKLEYDAMLGRIRNQLSDVQNVNPASNDSTLNDITTGDVDVAGIVEEENKKK